MVALKNLAGQKELSQNIVEPVPELGDGIEVIIKKLSIDELVNFQAQFIDDNNEPVKVSLSDQMVLLLNDALVNEDGEKLSGGDVSVIRQTLSGALILRLYSIASKLNGFSRKEVDEAKNNIRQSVR
ncbi:TPA: hypothetical protein ACXYO4_000446 [Escherichia coli]